MKAQLGQLRLNWANLELNWAILRLNWANLLLNWANMRFNWANLRFDWAQRDSLYIFIIISAQSVHKGVHSVHRAIPMCISYCFFI